MLETFNVIFNIGSRPMIKMTCNEHDVIEMARRFGRLNQFEYDGWLALFEYLEGFSEDIGEDIELDIITWCCNFQRFESVQDYNEQCCEDDAIADWDEIDAIVIPIDGTDAFITSAH